MTKTTTNPITGYPELCPCTECGEIPLGRDRCYGCGEVIESDPINVGCDFHINYHRDCAESLLESLPDLLAFRKAPPGANRPR
jgi:hypothetical protein